MPQSTLLAQAIIVGKVGHCKRQQTAVGWQVLLPLHLPTGVMQYCCDHEQQSSARRRYHDDCHQLFTLHLFYTFFVVLLACLSKIFRSHVCSGVVWAECAESSAGRFCRHWHPLHTHALGPASLRDSEGWGFSWGYLQSFRRDFSGLPLCSWG